MLMTVLIFRIYHQKLLKRMVKLYQSLPHQSNFDPLSLQIMQPLVQQICVLKKLIRLLPQLPNTQSTNICPPFETVSKNISSFQINNIVHETEQINVLTRPKELLNIKWKKGSFQKSETILHENNKLPNNISSTQLQQGLQQCTQLVLLELMVLDILK